MLWTEKYRPQNLQEVVGNRKALSALVKYFLVWEHGATEKNIIALVGPSGVGKTISAYLVAKKFGYDVIEINASDYRRKQDILEMLPAIMTRSPYGKKLILLDEIDGLTGADRGGLAALNDILRYARIPIVVTANDLSHQRFKSLLDKAYVVGFQALSAEEIKPFLLHIAYSEGLEISTEEIETIAKMAHGDMRYAINLLQSFAEGEAFPFFAKLRQDVQFSEMLKEKRLPKDIDKQLAIYWIYENLPRAIENLEKLEKAINLLSVAEISDTWYFSDYFINKALSLCEKRVDKLYFPENISMLGSSKKRRSVEKEVASVLSGFIHMGTNEIMKVVFPFLKMMSKQKREEIFNDIGLDFELREAVNSYWGE
jgi:replication factor C large subunit